MPGPACPPVPRATLSPAARCRCPRVAVALLCRLLPGIVGLREAPSATRVLKAFTPSCSSYEGKELPSATCHSTGAPKTPTQEEERVPSRPRRGGSSERGGWQPGLEAEREARRNPSAGNSAQRCLGSSVPRPRGCAQRWHSGASPCGAPTPADRAPAGLKTTSEASLAPGTTPGSHQLLSSPGWLPLLGPSHRTQEDFPGQRLGQLLGDEEPNWQDLPP